MILQKRLFTLLFLGAALLTLPQCESTEDNAVAEAQACFNGIGDTGSVTAAQACEQKIAGIYSPESYVIRCSIDFFVGGVTPTALQTAMQTAQNQTGNASTATLMGALSQDSPPGTPNLSYAQNTTYTDCQASGVESLIFFAGLSVTGTAMVAGGGASNFAANCAASPSSCSPATVGTTAQAIAGTYCQGANASTQACTILNSAIASGGGDPTTIGQNIFNLLNQ